MLAARRMMGRHQRRVLKPFLDATGCNHGGGWAMSSPITVGRRNGSTWTYTTLPDPDIVRLGIGDAYSVETVVTSKPTGSVNGNPFYYADWYAAMTFSPSLSGIFLETDNSSATLYLFRNGSIVLQTSFLVVGGVGWTPQVGDDVQLVTDFTAKTATVYVNGVVATNGVLNFAAQSWYTADGQSV